MTLQSIKVERITVPLKQPFATARRTAYTADILQIVVSDGEGRTGYGEAPNSAMVTGDTLAATEEAILSYIWHSIKGRKIEDESDRKLINSAIQSAIHANNSAKAAIEMALSDLCGQATNINNSNITNNDITISVGDLKTMTASALTAISDGFSVLKIKLGKSPETDAQRLVDLWRNIGNINEGIRLRIDANQGWTPKQAIEIIKEWENSELADAIDLIEQPVAYWDIEGLAEVHKHSPFTIAADESVFTPHDAARVIKANAASVINIKLMKCGGLSVAEEICELCRQNGLECMIGCMLEGNISTAWAAYLAARQPVITRVDLDSPLLLKQGYYIGGPTFGPVISFDDSMARPAL